MKINKDQKQAAEALKSGNILVGATGTGKSRVALAWYVLSSGGAIIPDDGDYVIMPPIEYSKYLLIITTAKKRDDGDWEWDCDSLEIPKSHVIVDSWNNIWKYEGIDPQSTGKEVCVIFDEHHAIGKGLWSKAFIKIARKRGVQWIVATATPGDKWEEYAPVFIANGFFAGRTAFEKDHVVWDTNPYIKYRKIKDYANVGKLMAMRKKICVYYDTPLDFVCHEEYIEVPYDIKAYNMVLRRRNPYNGGIVENPSEAVVLLRRASIDKKRRCAKMMEILRRSRKALIFYGYNFERDMIREALDNESYPYGEWNGNKKTPLPTGEKWAYLVQYSCSEAWNCITCDTIIFFSQTYSYKMFIQAKGRISRFNTPYKDLYYYVLWSRSKIEDSIRATIYLKREFNETAYIKKLGLFDEQRRKQAGNGKCTNNDV